MEWINNDFNKAYIQIAQTILDSPEYVTTNRKGGKIYELINQTITLTDLDNCYAHCRDMSMMYFIGELIFYLRGENKVKNINKYSKFWDKISDDGVNLNSCYGYYLFKMKMKSRESNHQVCYCIDQLLINKESKKAVMTIYQGDKHSYKTKDNPCTMFLQAYIRGDKLYLKTNMRSNDLWFGLPYDIPFFIFIQKMIYFELLDKYPKLKLGDYIHAATSLHIYEKDFEAVKKVIDNPSPSYEVPPITRTTLIDIDALLEYERGVGLSKEFLAEPFINFGVKMINNNRWLKKAWEVSKKSQCLKKEVGGVYVKDNKIIAEGWSGRPKSMGSCPECTRKNKQYYQDGCNSIHSEYRAVFNHCHSDKPIKDFKGSTVYLTHGPCDQCMKLLIELGVKKCIFDVYYKTKFEKYKGFIIVEDANGRVLTG